MNVAILLIAALIAPLQDGGKLPWNKDPKTAMAAAKKAGKPMMIFFTSEG